MNEDKLTHVRIRKCHNGFLVQYYKQPVLMVRDDGSSCQVEMGEVYLVEAVRQDLDEVFTLVRDVFDGIPEVADFLKRDLP